MRIRRPDVDLHRMDVGERRIVRDFEETVEGARVFESGQFTWLFQGGPEADSDGPSMWIACKDGRVVGRQGAIPFKLMVDGSAVSAAWAIDLIVAPEWRLKGVGPVLSQELNDHLPVVLGLGITDAAYATYRRAGWVDLGLVPRFMRPVSSTWLVSGGAPSGIARAGLALLDSVLRGADRLATQLHRLRGYGLECVARFDDAVDGVWPAVAAHHRALSHRDGSFLRWRFDEAPDRDRYVRYYLRKGSAVVGYAVLARASTPKGPSMDLVDYLVEPRDLSPLLRLLLQVPEVKEVSAVRCTTLNEAGSGSFHLAGFLPRPPDLRLMVHLRTDADVHTGVLTERGNWLVTMADGDQGFRLPHDVGRGAEPPMQNE